MDEPIMFTLREVALRLQLPYDVVRKAVYAGRWPHTQFTPRNRRMSEADIQAVIAKLHHEPAVSSRSGAHASSKELDALVSAL